MARIEAGHCGPEERRGTRLKGKVIRGLLLAVVVGGGAPTAIFSLLRHRREEGAASLLAGVLLAASIVAEIAAPERDQAWTPAEVTDPALAAGRAVHGAALRSIRSPASTPAGDLGALRR